VWPTGPHTQAEVMAAEDEIDAPAEGDQSAAKGKAIPRTDADIAELAIVTEQDTEDAAQDWRDKTMATYAGLVDATQEDEG
jgi:hypothetical protein